MAVRRWTDLDPERLKYEMIFTAGEGVAFNQLNPVRDFIQRSEEHD
jgi:hypothetical protein